MRPDDMPRNSQRDSALADLQAQRLREIDELLRECQRHGMTGIRVSYAQLMSMRAAVVQDSLAEAVLIMERLAREGHGPTFTQRSVGAGYTHLGIGETTDDLCAAIVALGKMSGVVE